MININTAIKELEKEFNFCKVFQNKNIVLVYNKGNNISLKYSKKENTLNITYIKEVDIFRCLFSTCKYKFDKDFSFTLNKSFNDLSIMIDVARNNVLRVETFYRLIKYLALLGYDSIRIYLEDLFEIVDETYFGHFRGRYSIEEIKSIVNYASIFGIKVIPCIQTLAHLKALKRWSVYSNLFDIDDILLVDNKETYSLIEKMIKSIKVMFNSDVINIGMDEAHNLGRGHYLDTHQYTQKFDIFFKHLNETLKITKKYNLKTEMWADMFFNSKSYAYDNFEYINKVNEIDPTLKLIYWDYSYRKENEYEKNIKLHKEITSNLGVAGGSWKWIGFSPNNLFAIKHNEEFIKAATKENIDTYILTCWGDNGGETSIFMSLPVIFKVSSLAYNVNDDNLFKNLTDLSLKDFLSVDYLNKTSFDFNDLTLNSLNRIFLYNDLMLGTYDSLVNEDQEKIYEIVSKTLQKFTKNNKFVYLFRSLYSLANVLTIKANLGNKLRKAYKDNNKNELNKLLVLSKKLLRRLNQFYKDFYKMWHLEAKDFGFDVMDLRLGGLIQRNKSLISKLNKYLNNEIDNIEEFEEDSLDVLGHNKEFIKANDIVDPFYSKMSTVNVND